MAKVKFTSEYSILLINNLINNYIDLLILHPTLNIFKNAFLSMLIIGRDIKKKLIPSLDNDA